MECQVHAARGESTQPFNPHWQAFEFSKESKLCMQVINPWIALLIDDSADSQHDMSGIGFESGCTDFDH